MPNLYNLNNPTYPYVFKYFQQNKQKRFRPTKKQKKRRFLSRFYLNRSKRIPVFDDISRLKFGRIINSF